MSCPCCGSDERSVRLPEGFDDETQGDPCTHPWHDGDGLPEDACPFCAHPLSEPRPILCTNPDHKSGWRRSSDDSELTSGVGWPD